MRVTKESSRLFELDALRGLAALAVVLYHYTSRYDQLFGHEKETYFNFSYGYLGVNLFFIISGFVIFMTLTRINSVKEFTKRRAIRLYPAYVVAVIVTFILVRLYNLEGRTVTLGEALINLTMFQGHIRVPHVDGSYWSLTVELTFYILMGFILYFGLSKKIVTFSLVWLSVSAGFMVINMFSSHNLIEGIVYLSISKYSHLFIAGIMFYLMREKAKTSHYLVIFACLMYDYIFMSLESNVFITVFFGMFYLLINNKLSFLNIKPFVFLGTISYSFYLVHQNIGYIIINVMENYGLISEVFLIIPVTISIGLATILTYFVEKPIQKKFRNKKMKNDTTSTVKAI